MKAYVALRLAGDSATAPHMQRAKQRVLDLGGLEATNSYVRFYLAMVGAIGWDIVPSIPPELMLLPDWFPLNLYEMSSWTRGIVIPLAIVYAQQARLAIAGRRYGHRVYSRVPGQRPPSFTWDKARRLLAQCVSCSRSRIEALRAFFLEAVSQVVRSRARENG